MCFESFKPHGIKKWKSARYKNLKVFKTSF